MLRRGVFNQSECDLAAARNLKDLRDARDSQEPRPTCNHISSRSAKRKVLSPQAPTPPWTTQTNHDIHFTQSDPTLYPVQQTNWGTDVALVRWL